MDTTKLIAVGNLQFGLLLLVMGIPLMLRKVPMNQTFGIRIRAAFESEQRWYDVNAYGGRQFFIWSWLLIIGGVIGFFVQPGWFNYYLYGDLLAAALALGMPLLLLRRWVRRP